MSSGIVVIIWAIVIWAIVGKILKNATGANKKTTAAKAKPPAASARKKGFVNYTPHKDIVSVSRDMKDRKNSSVLRDDKENDWLARQLREEHRAFKATSEMFDLKIEHASHCDSRLLQQFHHRNCSADGVDLANGHTVYEKKER
ncbi:MAG: hypothetical protein J5910_04975 [Lachnospiraceae bacterium]|nr:hypothetical protein [Lachnospiraceae bacterium]